MDLAEPIALEVAERFDPVDAALTKSESTFRSPRMFDPGLTSAEAGCVRWARGKSFWVTSMTTAALIGGPLYFTWGAFILFLLTTATTVCLGHSLGMHRRLIHRAYDCALWARLRPLMSASAVKFRIGITRDGVDFPLTETHQGGGRRFARVACPVNNKLSAREHAGGGC